MEKTPYLTLALTGCTGNGYMTIVGETMILGSNPRPPTKVARTLDGYMSVNNPTQKTIGNFGLKDWDALIEVTCEREFESHIFRLRKISLVVRHNT